MNPNYKTIKIAFFAALWLWGNGARACDACGCTPSMSALQVLPFFNQNLVGLYTSYAHFTHPASSFNNDGNRLMRDEMYTSTLVYRTALHEKVQVFYEVPFQYYTRHYDDHMERVVGIGDIAARLVYNATLFKNDKSVLVWRVSPRISLPTGNFMVRGDDRLMLPIGLQPGTGAWSGGGNMDMTLRTGKLGLQMWSSLQGFTENELNYRLGLRSTAGFTGSYFIETENSISIPFLGISHERYGNDMENGVVDETTGANRTAVTFGVSSYIHRLGFYAQCNLPITQNQSLDQPELRAQATIGFMYFLSANFRED